VVQLDEEVGAYRVVAVTGSTVFTGDLLLTVILTTSQAGRADAAPAPVVGANVTAHIEASGYDRVVPVPAEASRAAQGYYETTLYIPVGGDARITLQVTGPAGSATASFTLRRSPGWTAWVILGLSLLAAVGVATYSLVARTRKSDKE
jgi:hypothetical protein